MKVKSYLFLVVIFVVVLISSNFVIAITGSIGNARMVLSAEVGDTINKYVLVRNVNDVPVDINLSVSENLTKDFKLVEDSFTLQAGDEKKAYFTIEARKPGSYETQINVQFLPLEGNKSGVGLSSTVILNVYGKGELPVDEEPGSNSNATDNNTGSDIAGSSIGNKKLSPIIIILPIITLILLAALLFILTKAKPKLKKYKRADRSS